VSLFPVANFIPVTYKGALYSRPVSLLSRGAVLTNTGQQVSPPHQSSIVNADIDWINTYPGQAVTLILQNSQIGGPLLDQILMVYVDNTLNPANVTIIWADTQQSVDIPAFAAGYFPVFTSQYTCNVYNGKSGQSVLASQSQTTIQFCNFAVPSGVVQDGYSTSAFFNNQQQEINSSVIIPISGSLNTPLLPAVQGTYYVLSSWDITASRLGSSSTVACNVLFSLFAPVSGAPLWQASVEVGQATTAPYIPFAIIANKTNEQAINPVGEALYFLVEVTGNSLAATGTASVNISYRAVLS